MKVLKAHEFKRLATARKHDWDTILDGQIRELEADDMGAAKPSTFGGQARIQAKKRGMSVHLQATEDGLIVQAFTPDPNAVTETNGETPAPKKAKKAKSS